MSPGFKAFSCTANQLARVLVTPVFVAPAVIPNTPPTQPKQYLGIWDTGATATVITQQVIDECGLKQIGVTEVHGADGKFQSEVYLVDLTLPNGVAFPGLRVTKGKLPNSTGLLIGMDVIGMGDFAVTNHGGVTSFTYRYPSMERIDFTKLNTAKQTTTFPKVGRNDPCPCGSGLKYKKCHGN